MVKIKTQYHLVPPEIEEQIAKVFTYGATKHDKEGKKGFEVCKNVENVYYNKIRRHLTEHRKGNKYDKESGLLHLTHALADLGILVWNELNINKRIKK